MIKFVECTIESNHSGFGMWDCVKGDNEYEDIEELKDAIYENCEEMYELGADDLPNNILDIRGTIHNEPCKVYLIKMYGDCEYRYIGIAEA